MILTGEEIGTVRRAFSLRHFVHHKSHVTTLVSKLGHRTDRPVGQPGDISGPFPTFPVLGVRAQSPSCLIKVPGPLIIIVLSRLAATRLLFCVCAFRLRNATG